MLKLTTDMAILIFQQLQIQTSEVNGTRCGDDRKRFLLEVNKMDVVSEIPLAQLPRKVTDI